jgi:hypothetical protein
VGIPEIRSSFLLGSAATVVPFLYAATVCSLQDMSNVIVVDNLPRVDEAKFAKLFDYVTSKVYATVSIALSCTHACISQRQQNVADAIVAVRR